MKDILIPVSESPECAVALEQGFTLGQRLNSNVIGYHIRPHADSEKDLNLDAMESLLSPTDQDAAWESMPKKNSGHSSARSLFESVSQNFNYELKSKAKDAACSLWMERVGSPNKLFSIIGPVSDLIVVSRPLNKSSKVARTFMYEAVLCSSTPVLVLPHEKVPAVGKNISIAWNQSTEAAMAVKAAMPLLLAAENVNIITVGSEGRLGPKSSHLQTYLGHWGIQSQHINASGNNETEAILKGYEDTNSDLLIMGAYSRGRLRQMIFGGLTEHMLNEANIPVFLLHK